MALKAQCDTCGKRCFGYWRKGDLRFCGSATTGCGSTTEGATFVGEAAAKAEAFTDKGRATRSYSERGSGRKVGRGDRVSKSKSGKVTVRKLTEADRKRLGITG